MVVDIPRDSAVVIRICGTRWGIIAEMRESRQATRSPDQSGKAESTEQRLGCLSERIYACQSH